MSLQFINSLRDTLNDAINTAINSGAGAGIIAIYAGTKKASVATAPDGATPLLAKFTLADPAFAASSGGVMALDADPDLETTGVADGTATWFRAYSSADGTTINEANAKTQGTVGTSGSDINLNSVAITNGGIVRITDGTVTCPGA